MLGGNLYRGPGYNCGFCERPGGVSPIYQNVSDQTQLLRNDDDQWLEMMMIMMIVMCVLYQNVSNQLGWKISQTCGKVSTSYRNGLSLDDNWFLCFA